MSGPKAAASSKDGEFVEHLKVVSAKLGAYLHPSRSADVQLGVAETLNSLLYQYNEEFDGVVLAYLQPKVVGRTGKLLSGLYPYFHVELRAKVLLFCPKAGMKLDGKVNKLEKDHLGVLVLNVFNASIAITDIRDDLHFRGREDEKAHSERIWVSRTDDRHLIRLGSVITFTVKSVQEAEQFIDITGSLRSANTGCTLWLASRARARKVVDASSRKTENGATKHSQHLKVENHSPRGTHVKKRHREEDDHAAASHHKSSKTKHRP